LPRPAEGLETDQGRGALPVVVADVDAVAAFHCVLPTYGDWRAYLKARWEVTTLPPSGTVVVAAGRPQENEGLIGNG
jgi:hypothetical protein